MRGDEVQAWLDDDDKKCGENHTYVIFDDDSDFHPDQPLIKCNPACGLTLKDVIKAVDILGIGVNGNTKEVEDLRQFVDN